MNKRGIGLALSGGGSRAIAFHYGVLEAMHELGIDQKIDVVSAISGGAVIGALWNLYSKDWSCFSSKIELILRDGLETSILSRLIHPKLIFATICQLGVDCDIMADVLDKKVLDYIKLNEIPEKPLLILNATELKTGTNFKFSKTICGSYRSSGCVSGLRLSQAVACSAAYPLVFAVKKLILDSADDVYLTDGGAYDCIGANALMPDKGETSILVQNCETIIISDASFPYIENRPRLTRSIVDGLLASYGASSNRNRALIYNKLYMLNKSGEIPFLGTIKMDSKHPDLTTGWNKKELELINNYKTNFKPVTGNALVSLKNRGKESAKIIITKYLSHLLNN
ncbi:MAG: patatin-like phospholipase family protein [Candidatus Omnitrophica bacterium]|nr:patatin-like phospholipase family protein [Candidatus Omnitrophota bacterium]MDD5690480.1 patatin-like phospholipase family protein [Candidatus Omnitrophota bacterium]